jgi:hypothetical protein
MTNFPTELSILEKRPLIYANNTCLRWRHGIPSDLLTCSMRVVGWVVLQHNETKSLMFERRLNNLALPLISVPSHASSMDLIIRSS